MRNRTEQGRADRRRWRGFTLIELLTALAIIGIMLSVGVASYAGARRGAEMRSAVGTLSSSISLARQHAVTKRRTTSIVFRLEPNDRHGYYIFEKNGEAVRDGGNILAVAPDSVTWPEDGALIYNMDTDRIGRLYRVADPWQVRVEWVDGGSAGWNRGHSFAFQMSEKYYVPPGIIIKIDGADEGQILFYANGRTGGLGMRTIELTDRMGRNVSKTLEVYPLLGLVREETED